MESLWPVVIDQVLPPLLAAAVTVLAGFLTVAAKRLGDWLKERAAETENALLAGVLGMVANQAAIAVQHVAQTAVDNLKAASADGKLHPADAREALRAAVWEVWSSLGDRARDVLASEYGSLDAALKNVIEPAVEAKVRESKVSTPVVEPTVPESEARRELELARAKLASLTRR